MLIVTLTIMLYFYRVAIKQIFLAHMTMPKINNTSMVKQKEKYKTPLNTATVRYKNFNLKGHV